MEGHSAIVLVNNSTLPIDKDRTNPLGVMHKAVIDGPNDAERRIINSIMMAAGHAEEVSSAQQKAFIETEQISQKIY